MYYVLGLARLIELIHPLPFLSQSRSLTLILTFIPPGYDKTPNPIPIPTPHPDTVPSQGIFGRAAREEVFYLTLPLTLIESELRQSKS